MLNDQLLIINMTKLMISEVLNLHKRRDAIINNCQTIKELMRLYNNYYHYTDHANQAFDIWSDILDQNEGKDQSDTLVGNMQL